MIHEKIVEAIADAEDTEPANLNLALQDWVDMDAIQLLVNHDNAEWILRFEIPNHSVTITSENEILVDGREKRTGS